MYIMFKRRDPHGFFQTVREFCWPSMGWGRAATYLKHRVLRISDTPHNIALGLALGLGVSFTPLLGTHFVQAGALALMFRANVAAAILGTFVGNPLTFPFFWWAGFSFGGYLFTLFGLNHIVNLPDTLDMYVMWGIITTHPWDLFFPWMLGGYLLCIFSIPAAYYVYFYIVEGAKIARAKAVAMRQAKKARKQ